ncbi:uncharacterized protein BBA_00083 [Beauveria bassiana ARSEF 2860]|uniref:Uncharacterized protein n=1 Tax=Beauveria bassiana (strain ARSEF 2860) TaxID=655819 RepID=J5K205_BEAB2|nr:uncharacterized protein BBA_00083 [Beauveria bassiana ARSEF 2860]EJP70453.1 hypothetical protein BBA_00083 [Beauveria bassiana ARSEF 2860]
MSSLLATSLLLVGLLQIATALPEALVTKPIRARADKQVCLDSSGCSGSTPQCTVDAREIWPICCGQGQKAFYGQCWDVPNDDDIDVCVAESRREGTLCSLTQNYYCACIPGTIRSLCRCCRSDQVLDLYTSQCADR